MLLESREYIALYHSRRVSFYFDLCSHREENKRNCVESQLYVLDICGNPLVGTPSCEIFVMCEFLSVSHLLRRWIIVF